MRFIFFLFLLCCSLISSDLKIYNFHQNDNKFSLNWYISNTDLKVTSAKVFLNDNELNNYKMLVSPNEKLKTSIIFLIDKSVPMRKSYHIGIKPLLEKVIQKLDSKYYSYSIATFSKVLNIEKKFDDLDADFNKILNSIKINGQRTELYKLSLEALKIMEKEPKQNRKVMVIISDGDFEDTTYDSSDLIGQANKHNTQILSLGYMDSVKIQGIEKPAIETGGKLWIANKNTHKMKDNFINQLFMYLNNFGRISIDKNNLKSTENGLLKLKLKIDINDKVLEKDFTVSVDKIKKEIKTYNKWYYMTGILPLLLIIYFLLRIKRKNHISSEDIKNNMPIAYLISNSGEKYEITNECTSIGRKNNNDVVINGSFISSYHADILYKHGEFYIVDKNSTNGIGVNSISIKEGEDKITQSRIFDNDLIFIGPYELRFRIATIN